MRTEFQSQKVRQILQSNKPHYKRVRKLIKEFKSIVTRRFPEVSERERIYDALTVMMEVHFEQKDRPDGQPYVSHPLCVALYVLREYKVYDADVVVAALLHDSVEDGSEKLVALCCDGKWMESSREQAIYVLAKRFGERPAELVRILTNPDYGEIHDREVKNRLYLRHFKKIFHSDVCAFLIKMADFSQNALNLDVLEEGLKKRELRMKYCPVMLFVIEKLKSLDDSSHPLYGARDSLIGKLTKAYKRNCIS